MAHVHRWERRPGLADWAEIYRCTECGAKKTVIDLAALG
jgi:hypothetical protein